MDSLKASKQVLTK